MRALFLGDLCPTADNAHLFVQGDIDTLFCDTSTLFARNDMAMVNLECALTESEAPIEKIGPALKAPPAAAKVMRRVGITHCSLANNHFFDFGKKGAADTRAALDAAGIGYTGFGENVEDSRRNKWAQYHIAKAREYEKQYEAPQAEFEYKVALRLDPLDTQARTAYAAMLDRKGQQELYLEQLNFISSIKPVSVRVADTIEAYKSLLSDNLASRWGVEPFYLDKKRWNIGLYPYGTPPQLLHADASVVAVRSIASYFQGTATINAQAYPETASYSEAFRHARNAGQDYFVLLEFQETERELLLKASVFSGRNGTEVDSINIYRTGNDRLAGALRRLCNTVSNMMPTRGLIIDRNAEDVLVDLGSTDGMVKGNVLTVIKAGQIKTPDNTIGLEYADTDILGTITLTEVSESVSQGRYTRGGFFDRMNIKDEVIIIPATTEETAAADGQSGGAPQEAGTTQATTSNPGQSIQRPVTPTAEEVTGSEYPVLSRMLQDIYVIQ